MKTLERSGRTVDEAVAAALQELGLPSERVKIEVLDEGKAGFLGIGARPATVRVQVKETRRERAESFLRDVCAGMGVEAKITFRDEGEFLYVDMSGPEAGILIGHHGKTLNALQYLLGLSVSKVEGETQRVILDVEGYRRRREETLARLASRMAQRVKRSGQPVVLEPMKAHERRIIHLSLQNDPDVVTSSEGEDPFRRVIIQLRR